MVKNIGFFTIGLFVSVFVALAGATNANAASVYDDVVNIVDEAFAYNSETCTTNFANRISVYDNWYADLVNNNTYWGGAGALTNTQRDTVRASLTSTFSDDNGYWGISVYDRLSGAGEESAYISIWWVVNGNVSGNFTLDRVFRVSRTTGAAINRIQFEIKPETSCLPKFTEYTTTNSSVELSTVTSSGRNPFAKIYFAFLPTINYPSGYEGDIPPDVPAPAAETINDAPQIEIRNILDFKATVGDNNFNTFDGNPFTCDGLAPAIIWTFYDTDGITVLSTESLSATLPIEYQYPKLSETLEYTITAQYDCGTGYIFPNSTTITFSINRAGIEDFNPLQDCFTDTFPFIDLPACVANMGYVLNLLTFDLIPTLEAFTVDDTCTDIPIVSSYIGISEDTQACPFFNQQIRDLITPFVTFLLGMISLWVITRSTNNG